MSNVRQHDDDDDITATDITTVLSSSPTQSSTTITATRTTPTALLNKNRKKVKDLNDIITCSLCQGYYIEATTINECVHTCKYTEMMFVCGIFYVMFQQI